MLQRIFKKLKNPDLFDAASDGGTNFRKVQTLHYGSILVLAPVPLGIIGSLNWVGAGPRVWGQGLTIFLQTYTTIKHLSKSGAFKSRIIKISLPQTVEIERVRRIPFDIMTVLSYLGSNMGLFLGLGVLQFVELFYSKMNLLLKE